MVLVQLLAVICRLIPRSATLPRGRSDEVNGAPIDKLIATMPNVNESLIGQPYELQLIRVRNGRQMGGSEVAGDDVGSLG
jgi:hypothetical protein